VYWGFLSCTSLLTFIICRLFDNSHLTSVRLYLLVILICISLISDVEHLFMYLLVICVSFWKKCLSRSSTEFLIEFFVGVFFFFLTLNCMSCLSILYINSLQIISFANVFSYTVGCLLVLSMDSFTLQKHLNLIKSRLFIFAFISFALGHCSKKRYFYDLYQGLFCLWCFLGVL